MHKTSKTKALFLDRDGVINYDFEYLYKIENFDFIPNIFDLCRDYLKNEYKIFVITNQSGIARGFFTVEDLDVLHKWVLDRFLEQGVKISKIYSDITHPDFSLDESFNRKPNPGMILQAENDFNIDLSRSVLIGDKDSDVQCGINAKIKTIYKLHSDKYKEEKKIYEQNYPSSTIVRVNKLKDIIS